MVKFSVSSSNELKQFEVKSRATKENVKKYLDTMIKYIEVLTYQCYLGKKLFQNNQFIRQLIFKSHRIIYQVKDIEINIIFIIHTKRNFNKFVSKYLNISKN